VSLFQYPEKALVNRNIPKTKFYQYANINKATKESFVSQVQQIIWVYKLAPETVNLAASNGLCEIEVFDIYLKTRDLDNEVLISIDKAIPHPIIFQLHFEELIKSVSSYKRQNEVDKGKWIIEKYYFTPWMDKRVSDRIRLPVSIDLNGLYENILRKFLNVEATKGQTFQELNSQVTEIECKEKEIARLEQKIKSEKQFNRKVELNNKLNQLRKYLSSLTS
jgi:hypothetical protein